MNWHERYLQQAGWTRQTRNYIIKKAGLPSKSRILDVGCGTGALLSEFSNLSRNHGIDINFNSIQQSKINSPGSFHTCGNGTSLPYLSNSFDMTFCHFVLLWISQPEKMIAEMVRVTKPGGFVVAFAEPDYGGRIDYPTIFKSSSVLQADSLKSQGADPEIGRKLPYLFNHSGLSNINYGIIGGEWEINKFFSQNDLEINMLAEDLNGMISDQEINQYILEEYKSRRTGERVIFIPTFFAFGIAA